MLSLFLQLVKKPVSWFAIDFSMQCVIMTQTTWPGPPPPQPPTPAIFIIPRISKINSFLRSVLNICILGNLIVRWGEWVITEGVGFLYDIYKFSGGVNTWSSRIHQSKTWYYLGPSQTSKLEYFAEIVFG